MSWKWKLAQWAELKWWKRYLGGKDKQEYLAWKKDYWRGVLNEIDDVLKIDEKKALLEVGCGPAGLFTLLTKRNLVATDPLLNKYESELDFFDRSDYPGTTFYAQSLENLALDQKFDCIFCMNVINHVQDIHRCYDRLEEHLVPEGVLVVSVDAHHFRGLKHLFRLIPGDILHPQQHDLNDYRSFLTNRNLKVAKEILLKKDGLFNHWVHLSMRLQ